MVYLVGAPPHKDTYDLKVDAPADVRGEFKPIATSVAGIQVCEHLPKLASVMDKCVPLRSVYGSPDGDHDSFICYTGRSKRSLVPGTWPSFGSMISKVLGPATASVPPFVGLAPTAGHPPYGSLGRPWFLGVSHVTFRPAGEVRKDMALSAIDPRRRADRAAARSLRRSSRLPLPPLRHRPQRRDAPRLHGSAAPLVDGYKPLPELMWRRMRRRLESPAAVGAAGGSP